MKVLFVSWDGPAQNYMESLFLPVLGRVRQEGHSVDVVQFTWSANDAASIHRTSRSLGISYSTREVRRKPLVVGTAVTIAAGAAHLARYVREHKVDVLMPRSIIPLAMALLAKRSLPGVKLFFDADGLMADERVDFAGWSRAGAPYRVLSYIEREGVRRADVVMVRTARAKELLIRRSGGRVDPERIHVIPNAKDQAVFQPGTEADRREVREGLGMDPGAPLLAYVGSVGPHYHPREMVALFSRLWTRRPDSKLLVLTGNRDRMDEALRGYDLPESSIVVDRVPPGEVPRYLAAADLGIAFRTPSFSQQAVSPIKVGEYLLCGVPVASTKGVGDLDAQLGTDVGRLVDDLQDSTLEGLVDWLLEDVLPRREIYRTACRSRGVDLFGLDQCTRRLRRALADCATAA
jgi:glycosyltransferase involved in cell wall biosynthesis